MKLLIILVLWFLIIWLLDKNKPNVYTSARQNVNNCAKISLDDTLEEVLRVMGNPDKVYKPKRKVNGKLMIVKNYYYPAPLAASVGVHIYFDPISNRVIDIECKDKN